MKVVLDRLKEGAAGQPGPVKTPSKGLLSVSVTSREGRSLVAYAEAAEAVLERLMAAKRGRPLLHT